MREHHAEHLLVRVAGVRNAPKTAMLAWAPACGCTFAWSAPKSCLRPVDRELLGDVDELAPAVVAAARVALGVLVVHRRADRREHGRARVVLRRDQAQRACARARARRRSRRRPRGRWPSGPPSRPRTPCMLQLPSFDRSRSAPAAARADRPRTASPATPGRSPARRRARPPAPPMRQHVRVVVLAREPREVQVVAERRPDPVHLVRGDLLALARAARARSPRSASPADDRARRRRAERRVVDGLLANRCRGRRTSCPSSIEERLQVLLQGEAGVVAADRDPHRRLLAGRRRRRLRAEEPVDQPRVPLVELPRDRPVGLERAARADRRRPRRAGCPRTRPPSRSSCAAATRSTNASGSVAGRRPAAAPRAAARAPSA